MSALVASLALFAACSDDLTYTPGEQPTGEGVYFSNELASTIELQENDNSVTIPVSRSNADAAFTAALEISTEYGSVFNIPSSVTFAAGQKTADVKITFDFADIVTDTNYGIKLSLVDPSVGTPYGSVAYTFTILYSPWEVLGMGLYTDDMMTTVYKIDPFEFPVEVQESKTTPGKYRIKNPYHQDSPFFAEYSFEESTGATEDYFIVIDATDPEEVLIPQQPLGVTVNVGGYGKIGIGTVVAGAMANGIIRFPAKGLAFVKEAGAVYANLNGAFKLALPGAAEPAKVNVAYNGQFMSPAGLHSAMLGFSFDPTAASCKYAVVAGNILKDETKLQQTISGINDGSIESETLTAGGDVKYPVTVAGAYTVVAVAYDAKGNQGEATAIVFNFILGDQKTVKLGSYDVAISASTPYVSTFTIELGTEPNQYIVNGLYDVDMPMLATFDPVALKLTLDGTTVEEPTEKIWTVGLGYASPDKTLLWCMAGSGNSLDGDVEIEIDADGVPVKFLQTWGLFVFEAATGKGKGWMEQIVAETAISESAPEAAKRKVGMRQVTSMSAMLRK